MAQSQASSTVRIENERVRVTEWRLSPGGATGYHRHEYDYVVVPLTDGKLTLTGPDGGRTVADLAAGQPYFRNSGVEHDVQNTGASEIVFVEIELKR